MATKNLLQIKPKQTVQVHEFEGSPAIKEKFEQLGCLKGTAIRVESYVAFGGPVLISLRDTKFAVRREDARHICVTDTEC